MILIVFVIALIARFLFFPNNIYFGFDQARDAFEVSEIIHGNLKLIGPSTSFEGLFHGIAYYYLIVLSYFLSASPEVTAAFLRFLNALGVFAMYYLGGILFNKKVGLIAALLFAFSFEQTQFAIYMGNPSPAALTVPLMYLGLALVIFKRKSWGLPLATFCLGLSIQFQFALFYLIVPFALIVIFFRKDFRLPLKIYIFSFASLVMAVSTFILVELKYDFKTIHGLLALAGSGSQKNILTILQTYIFQIGKMLEFNLIANLDYGILVGAVLLVCLTVFYKNRLYRKQLTFMSIWFFSLVITIIVSGGVSDLANNVPLYYPNVGVSASLLLFVALIISQFKKVGLILIFVILIVNINQILLLNPKGTIPEIDVQQGMLLGDEKLVLDYLYTSSNGQPFAVKAVTMPFNINTTWSYLFEWYGKDKYGYLPLWNGENAIGFPGHLAVEKSQEKLPSSRYLIIEPTRGIAPHLINQYIQEENYFTKVVEEKSIGEFIIQKREKY